MKHFLLTVMIPISHIAWAECDYKNAGLVIGTHVISPVKVLKEKITLRECKVSFVVTVDSPSEMYEVKEAAVGSHAKGADLCRIAIRNGIKKLLLTLGKSEDGDTHTICREGKKIKVGDLILESEVGFSKVNLYFKYQNSLCRNFAEQYYDDVKVKKYFGVICQNNYNKAKWIVKDKW